MTTPVPFRWDEMKHIITYWGGVFDSPQSWTGVAENERARSGMRVAHWRKLIANNQSATSPYLVSGRHYSSKEGSARKDYFETGPYSYRAGSYDTVFGDIAAYVAETNSWDNPAPPVLAASQETCDAAYFGFMQKIRSKQTSIQGLVFLGESRQTVRMLVNPAKTFRAMLTRYISRAKRSILIRNRFRGRRNPGISQVLYNPGEYKDIVRSLSDLWLEFSFGAQPLLSDMKGICEAVQKSDAKPRVVRVSDFANNDSRTNVPIECGLTPDITLLVRFDETIKDGCRYTGALDWKSQPRSVERLNELCGFQLRDFVPSVYELIPFSFVVDYFSTVGDVIGAAFTATNNMLWWSRTRRRIQTTKWSVIGAKDANPGVPGDCSASSSEATRELFHIQRDIPSLWDVPTITLRLPGLSTKWINLAALLAQAKL